MAKNHVQYHLIFISDKGADLLNAGAFDSKKGALGSVDKLVFSSPKSSVGWRIIKVTKETLQEGHGYLPLPGQTKPSPANQAHQLQADSPQPH